MAKLAVLAVLASLLGAVSCDMPIYARWGWSLPNPSLPRYGYPLPRAYPQPSPTPALKVDYYKGKCSSVDVEKIVYDEVKKANPGVQAGLVRLFFHDCFVRGCDASVLLNQTASGTDTEKTGFPNLSLRGFKVIDDAKREIEKKCPDLVSCADIVAFAGRDASKILSKGRINYKVPAGRFDGNESLASETLGQNLPPPFANLEMLTAMFAAKGLDQHDMVVLSGAHSIGDSHCGSFDNRVPAPANPTNTSMEPGLAAELSQTCSNGNSETTVPQDRETRDLLDNQYYKNVLNRTVLFDSDAALASSQTKDLVDCYASNQNCSQYSYVTLPFLGEDGPTAWYRHFGEAMVKMGYIGVKNNSTDQGEIRKECSFVNPKP